MTRQVINSPDYHVPIEGFSQIVSAPRDGRVLYVSGLTSRDGRGTVVGAGDPAQQMRQIFLNLSNVLAAADASLDDVVSIRTYVTDIECWSELEQVWREHWGDAFPASTMVQIGRLFDETQLVEMEATAVVSL